MKGRPGITGRNLLEKGLRFLKRDVVIFAFFLLLSFFFWYLNSLRKDVEVEMKYPVKYLNPPKDKVVSNDPPQKLLFYLKGPGYSIIKLKLSGSRAPVNIDFSKVVYKRVPDSQPPEYYIVSGNLINSFSKQLRADFQILSVKPDTLYITFDKKK